METKNIYFISGIDTDAGKSYCTAYYACQLIGSGKRVITQKFIQTGNIGLFRGYRPAPPSHGHRHDGGRP